MVQLQVSDLERAFSAIGAKENPIKAVGGLLGFSGSEVDAGIPTWAWLVVATGVGIFIGRELGRRELL